MTFVQIKSIARCANYYLLFSGNVHIYYINDFDTINFNTIDSKKLIFESTAVISLNIVVHIEEFLIVTYEKKIYIVKFI